MAFAKRRFFPRRTVARRKRNGAWTGSSVLLVNVPATIADVTTSLYLWSDLDSQRLNMGGRGVHQRTIVNIALASNELGYAFALSWSLNVYQTDAANNVPTTAILAPHTQGAALAEKSPLDYGFRIFTAESGSGLRPVYSGLGATRDIKVKRRLDDTDALMLTLQCYVLPPNTSALNQRVWVQTRTYVTW